MRDEVLGSIEADFSGRNLLQIHRCSGRELLLGNASVSGSIFALLLVGFLVGLITGAALMYCCRRRKKTILTCEQGFNSPAAPMPGNDYTHQGVKHKKSQSALIRDDAAAAGVPPAYDLDDLDDEWKALLSELDDRLYQGGKQGMDAEDRAVAVRSLLVSTARETPEAALAKALEDIDRHRRALRR
ncbi:hypothetical protein WJX75_003950 [Coccomyxa subellipsoidea]|uniref:Uncharacterized protein n=1 Tax=Coccomyxa subellipsoidea TaxID=248742 RepID=A0ABR2YHY6_9CHLO